MHTDPVCYNAVARNSTDEYDNCITTLLALRSRDQATSNDTCSSFMASVMAEFVSGALRTSSHVTNENKTWRRVSATIIYIVPSLSGLVDSIIQ